MIYRESRDFLKCDGCGDIIKPKQDYVWDEDSDKTYCLSCAEEVPWPEAPVENIPFFDD